MGDRPLFRPEAEQFRLHRHLGTIVLFRPVTARLLAAVPLVISGLLVLGAAHITVRPRFIGLTTAPATGDHVMVTLEANAAGAIALHDRLTVETSEPIAVVQGTVVSLEAVDCRAQALPALVLGASSQHRPCLAAQLAVSAPLPRQRTPLVTVRAAGRSYLSHLLGR